MAKGGLLSNLTPSLLFCSTSMVLMLPPESHAATAANACAVWQQVAGTMGPGVRANYAICYDSKRNRVVLFGGRDFTTWYGDTWEWDGANWTKIPVAGPSPRDGMSMVFDEARGVSLLFGGCVNNGPYSGETWTWDGSTWTRVSTTGPSPRTDFGLTYDKARQRVVLFGGGCFSQNSDTWEWNGASWTRKSTSGPRNPGNCLNDAGIAYDDASGFVLRFNNVDGTTWRWDGASWTLLRTDPSLVGAGGYGPRSMVFDEGRRRVVMIGGGCSSSLPLGAAWQWTGTAWSRLTGDLPSPRQSIAVYSTAQQRILLFGGWAPSVACTQVLNLIDGVWAMKPGDAVLITDQPEAKQLLPGTTATFTVTASGNTLQYAWRKNGAPLDDAGRITGSRTPTLTISGVVSSDQGNYDCIVTNGCDSVQTAAAKLSCEPLISQQPPVFLTPRAGAQVTVAVPAGANYTFRWRQNGQNLFNVPGLLSGVTTPTLTLLSNDASLHGVFDCVLTNACGVVTTAVSSLCSGDLNGDRVIDDADFSLFVPPYDLLECSDPAMAAKCPADLNGDTYVDDSDFSLFVNAYDILLCP